MEIEEIKIGITIGLKDNKESIWTNGIKQNVLMLVHLLKKSHKRFRVFLLNTINIDLTTKPGYLKDIDIYNFNDVYEQMDLIIVMGAQIHNHQIETFKSTGEHKKVISYKCGNNYVITMENILFKSEEDDKKVYQVEDKYDEVWYIPQQDEVNSGFYKTLYRTKAIIVPFIWHHKFLTESVVDIHRGFKSGTYKKDYMYEPKEKKIIGIMEPNLNIVKFCLIPTLITEECYRGEIGKKHIEKLRITNSGPVAKNKEFLSMLSTFDLYKDGKISAESRYQTAYMLTQYLDIVICHQILNPLNYLYLDVAFLEYPILHNAPMCKDIGYYYEGSDTEKAAKLLDWILENHDNNKEEYAKRNKKALFRWSADNRTLIESYDKLIWNLFNGGNEKLEYDSERNILIEKKETF
jgi:hypothetical protein